MNKEEKKPEILIELERFGSIIGDFGNDLKYLKEDEIYGIKGTLTITDLEFLAEHAKNFSLKIKQRQLLAGKK